MDYVKKDNPKLWHKKEYYYAPNHILLYHGSERIYRTSFPYRLYTHPYVDFEKVNDLDFLLHYVKTYSWRMPEKDLVAIFKAVSRYVSAIVTIVVVVVITIIIIIILIIIVKKDMLRLLIIILKCYDIVRDKSTMEWP